MSATDQSSMFFYDDELGWFWTNNTTYPYLYSISRGAWLYYNGVDGGLRFFYNFGTGMWESLTEG